MPRRASHLRAHKPKRIKIARPPKAHKTKAVHTSHPPHVKPIKHARHLPHVKLPHKTKVRGKRGSITI